MKDTPETTQTASIQVAEAVADRTGTDVTELEPLYSTIDPEALDTLVESMEETGVVRFDYEGYRVVVYGDATVDVVE